MRALSFSVLLAALGAAMPAAQTVPTPADVARRLQAHYGTVLDFKADFTSEYREGVLPPTSERGTVLVKKPGRMRWTWAAPDPKVMVADGVKIYTHLIPDKQVIIAPMPKTDEASTALLFLMGKGDLLRDFTPSLGPTQPESEWQLALKPKSPQAEFTSLMLIVDRQSLGLRGFVTIDNQGGSSTFRFQHLQENVGLRDQQFDFKIPSNAEVIYK